MLQCLHSSKEKSVAMFYLQCSPFKPLKNLIINNQTTSLLCLSILDVHPILTAPAKRAHTRSGVLRATHLLTSADICY